jgi:hypothetical protein
VSTYVAGTAVRVFIQGKNVAQELTDATTLTVVFTKPDASTVTVSSPTHDGTGLYHADVTTDSTGLSGSVTSATWTYKGTSTGIVAVAEGSFIVTS